MNDELSRTGRTLSTSGIIGPADGVGLGVEPGRCTSELRFPPKLEAERLRG